MAAVAVELCESDTGRQGQSNVKRYLVTGAATRDDANTATLAFAPTTVGQLVRQPADIAPIDGWDESWFVTLEYGQNSLDPYQRDEMSFALDMTEGTGHVTMAIVHQADYAAAGGTAESHGGAINVVRSGADVSVEGIDVPIPSCKFSRTIYVHPDDLTAAYLNVLYTYKGGYNNATFTVTTDDGVSFVFATGEVTFLGAQMQKQGRTGNWPVVQNFKAEPNLSGATIGPFTGVNKLGADYIWFEFGPGKGTQQIVAKPLQAHVERVAYARNFADLVP